MKRSGVPGLLISVMAAAMAVTTLNVLADTRAAAAAVAAPVVPKFLDRLPLKPRGAEVWAVEAQDHCPRLSPPRGRT
jgi:hypothetical protein